ncbi:hypothetical protein O7626_14760 [Micromonospora sp. WMMD1102]|uniref:hypothetical protein n=1 Tax=Micromonospora sp. WMMD1102 TaxID=3016105 RepID=UPI0024156E50|nr:hypothetical protein [Micromonospora sp. WMMD1102]MDG4787176.1 hypothetical protein [Micromonospora sp. WMMD1102]
MNSGVRIGLAVGFGYLLGRRKKLRSALVLATAVAAGRASRGPGGLLKQGQQLLQSSPQLSGLSRLGSPLVSASRAAATAAAGSRIDALSGRLRGGADALRRRSSAADADGDQPEESGQDQPQRSARSRDENQQAAAPEPERGNAGSRRGR